jgi:Tol biopolymer transport system component
VLLLGAVTYGGLQHYGATFPQPSVLSTRARLSPSDAIRAFSGFNASWSPDSAQLVLLAPITSDLVICDIESGRRQTLPVSGGMPVWSPRRGGPIVYVGGPRNATYLCTIFSDGTGETRIAGTPTGVSFPSWSHTGRVLYFWHAQSQNIHWLDMDKADAQSVPLLRSSSAWPAVSPDEQLVAYQDGEFLVLKTYEDQTILRHQLPRLDGKPWRGLLGNWSPDSRFLGFGSFGAGEGLWLFERYTKQVWKVAEGALTAPRWSHDGRFVAVDDRGTPQQEQVLIFDAEQFQSLPE